MFYSYESSMVTAKCHTINPFLKLTHQLTLQLESTFEMHQESGITYDAIVKTINTDLQSGLFNDEHDSYLL